MKLSYYTIDDLRLGHDPRGVTGWRLSQFLDWRDALEHYNGLPKSVVKELGVTNGRQVLSLVRCLPLIAGDLAGEDVLAADYLTLPAWKDEPRVLDMARELVSCLNIRYCLDHDRVIPAPTPLPENLAHAFLWGRRPGDCASAIRWIYVAGVGWLSPEELRRRYPQADRTFRYPLVLKYRVDTRTESGQFEFQEVTPWDYKHLEQRTKQRACSNK